MPARIGYRNVNKGARRLERLERFGVEAEEFVGRVASSLGLPPERVAELAARDEDARRAEFEAWLQVPQPMVLYRYVAGMSIEAPLPEGLSEEEAVAYATDLQRREGIRVCLVLGGRPKAGAVMDG